MYNELVGKIAYKAGASGTVTLPINARIINIIAHASTSGTVSIFGGDNIPVIGVSGINILFNHQLFVSGNNSSVAGSQNVVFTGTDSYFVEYVVN